VIRSARVGDDPRTIPSTNATSELRIVNRRITCCFDLGGRRMTGGESPPCCFGETVKR
jgi:hypothetical protein